MKLARIMLSFLEYLDLIVKRPRVWIYRWNFEKTGRNFHFDPDGCYSFENISVGDDVYLESKPTLMAAMSKIKIGSKVMFGPEVMIVGGGHNIDALGRFMVDVHEKRPGDDLGVIIEDDVWIGARAIILRGVTVGRGAVVGGGSVVTKSIPPYAIVVGNPARVLRYRFSIEDVLKHEEMLYPIEKRLKSDELLRIRETYPPKRS